jgi:signal transduction histidine kinase
VSTVTTATPTRIAQHRRPAIASRREPDPFLNVSAGEDRLSLARDIHDVVGSAMTTIHLYANMALRALEQRPEEAAEALRTIATSSKQSLGEVRSLVAVLRRAESPHPFHSPTLAGLESLVSTSAAGGLEATVTVSGDLDNLSQAHDQAAYRIVQEALTNVLRHANATRVDVVVSVDADALRLQIADNGAGPTLRPAGDAAPGRGITGMRERAHLLGGELTTHRVPESGFCVRARLPLTRTLRGDGSDDGV